MVYYHLEQDKEKLERQNWQLERDKKWLRDEIGELQTSTYDE